MRVRSDSRHSGSGTGKRRPYSCKANEEELFLSIIQTRKSLSWFRSETNGRSPSGIGLSETGVGDIFAVREVAIDIYLLAARVIDVIFAILLGNALGAFFESLNSRICPPVAKLAYQMMDQFPNSLKEATIFPTFVVVLTARIIESVRQLVRGDCAERAVFKIRRPRERIKGRLEDACRKDNLAVWRSCGGVSPGLSCTEQNTDNNMR